MAERGPFGKALDAINRMCDGDRHEDGTITWYCHDCETLHVHDLEALLGRFVRCCACGGEWQTQPMDDADALDRRLRANGGSHD